MANAHFSTSGHLGVKIDTPTTDQEFDLGTTTRANDNRTYIYVQANGAVATGTCTVDASYQLTDAAGNYTAGFAFADNEYGWVYDTTGTTA